MDPNANLEDHACGFEQNAMSTKGSIEICTQCGYSHLPKNRRRLITRMVIQGVKTRTIKLAWSCFYPHRRKNDASDRRLWRDIAAIKKALTRA